MTETGNDAPDQQLTLYEAAHGRIMAMDSAYMVCAENDRDVVINASYCGVLPARFIGRHHPRGSIGVDCAVGPAGASIAGLWYLEALHIPAAVADVFTVLLGNGKDLYENGVVSFVNGPAADAGVYPGMPVRDAAMVMLQASPTLSPAEEITNRKEMYRNGAGRAVICLDSIAFGTDQDVSNVLVTAGHSGRSALPYFLKIRPHGFICSDGGMGRDASGVAGMHEAAKHGIAGAAVDARTAMMGSGQSSYHDGVISAANTLAYAAGVREGMACAQAAKLLADAAPAS